MDWTKWFSKDGDPEEQRNAPQPEDAAPVGEQPEAPAAPSADPAAPAKAPSVKDYITQKYGLADTYSKMAGDDSTVDAARAGAADDKRRARTIEGLSTMFAGRKHTDSKFYDGLAADADAKVAGAQKDKAGKLSDFLTTDKLVGEEATRNQQDLDNQHKNDLRDATKPESTRARAFYAQMFPDMAKMEGFDSLSAGDIKENLLEPLKLKEMIEGRKEAARLRNQTASEGQKNRQTEGDRKVAQADMTALGKDLDSQTASSRQGLGVAQTKLNGVDRVLGLVGVSPEDVRAAKSEKPNADGTPGPLRQALTERMNKVSPQYYSEIVSGLANQIAPGQGTLGQFESLRANSADEQMAKIKQYFSANPQPAGMGEFLTQNLDSLINERDANQKVISDHQAKMKAKHPRAFAHPETAPLAQTMFDAFANSSAAPEAAPSPQAGAGKDFPRTLTNPKTGATARVSNEAELKEASGEGFQ